MTIGICCVLPSKLAQRAATMHHNAKYPRECFRNTSANMNVRRLNCLQNLGRSDELLRLLEHWTFAACVEVLLSGCEVPAIFPNAYIMPISYLIFPYNYVWSYVTIGLRSVALNPPPLPSHTGAGARGIIVLPWPWAVCGGGNRDCDHMCIYIYMCVCVFISR